MDRQEIKKCREYKELLIRFEKQIKKLTDDNYNYRKELNKCKQNLSQFPKDETILKNIRYYHFVINDNKDRVTDYKREIGLLIQKLKNLT